MIIVGKKIRVMSHRKDLGKVRPRGHIWPFVLKNNNFEQIRHRTRINPFTVPVMSWEAPDKNLSIRTCCCSSLIWTRSNTVETADDSFNYTSHFYLWSDQFIDSESQMNISGAQSVLYNWSCCRFPNVIFTKGFCFRDFYIQKPNFIF